MATKTGTDKKEIWDELRNIPLTAVVERLYPTAKKKRDSVGYHHNVDKTAREAWKYTLTQGDHVKVAGQTYVFFERGIGGGGAIDFYSEVCGVDAETAMRELAINFCPNIDVDMGKFKTGAKRKAPPPPAEPEIPKRPKEPKEWPLPQFSKKHHDEAKKYLTGRGFDPDFVDKLIESRVVYPAVIWKKNKRPDAKRPFFNFKNLVFPVTSLGEGKVTGVSTRSLTDASKINEGNKEASAFQINPYGENTKRIVLTESPIEALSYYQQHQPDPSVTIVGQSGTSVPLWFLYEAGKERGCVIQSSLNNDIPARLASGKNRKFCQAHGIKFEEKVPDAGEVEMLLDDTESNRNLIQELIGISESKNTSLLCKKSPTGEYKLRLDNTRESCRAIFLAEKKEKDRVRDENRQRRIDFRCEHPKEPFPEDPKFLAEPQKMEIKYYCTDWNDSIQGNPDKIFTPGERVFEVPKELQMNPAPTIRSKAAGQPQATKSPALESSESPSVDVD